MGLKNSCAKLEMFLLKKSFRNMSNRHTYSNFDTFKFVQRLEQDGFSREISEAIMNSLNEVVHEQNEALLSALTTRQEFEKQLFAQSVDCTSLESEVTLLEKNEVSLLKHDIGKLQDQLSKLQQRIKEDMRRIQSNVRMELSIEKGLLREKHAAQEFDIKETMSKIDSEISSLRTMVFFGLTFRWKQFNGICSRRCSPSFLLRVLLRSHICGLYLKQ